MRPLARVPSLRVRRSSRSRVLADFSCALPPSFFCADMRARREATRLPPMTFGSAGYVVVRSTDEEVRREVDRIVDVRQSAKGYSNYQEWIGNTQLEQRVSLEDYSVSNRGLRSGLVGTPEQVVDRIRAFEEAGVDLLLLQFSPHATARDQRELSGSHGALITESLPATGGVAELRSLRVPPRSVNPSAGGTCRRASISARVGRWRSGGSVDERVSPQIPDLPLGLGPWALGLWPWA